MDELIDIVNENDEVIEQKYRSEINDHYRFRVINAFLMNDKKEIWIPRRSLTKKFFPFCLDASVGGYVKAGENYEEAFKRELEEELNINPDEISYKFIAKLTPVDHKISAFMCVYLVYLTTVPNYNLQDIYNGEWIPLDKLEKRIEEDLHKTNDLPKVIRNIISYL